MTVQLHYCIIDTNSQQIHSSDSFTAELLMQPNFIDLQFLQEEVKGFFLFDTLLRTNQWVNDLPPSAVVNGSSRIRQQESIDIEKRRSIHPSQSSILHFQINLTLIKREKKRYLIER